MGAKLAFLIIATVIATSSTDKLFVNGSHAGGADNPSRPPTPEEVFALGPKNFKRSASASHQVRLARLAHGEGKRAALHGAGSSLRKRSSQNDISDLMKLNQRMARVAVVGSMKSAAAFGVMKASKNKGAARAGLENTPFTREQVEEEIRQVDQAIQELKSLIEKLEGLKANKNVAADDDYY